MAASSEHARPLVPVPGMSFDARIGSQVLPGTVYCCPLELFRPAYAVFLRTGAKENKWTARHVGACEGLVDKTEGFWPSYVLWWRLIRHAYSPRHNDNAHVTSG